MTAIWGTCSCLIHGVFPFDKREASYCAERALAQSRFFFSLYACSPLGMRRDLFIKIKKVATLSGAPVAARLPPPLNSSITLSAGVKGCSHWDAHSTKRTSDCGWLMHSRNNKYPAAFLSHRFVAAALTCGVGRNIFMGCLCVYAFACCLFTTWRVSLL